MEDIRRLIAVMTETLELLLEGMKRSNAMLDEIEKEEAEEGEWNQLAEETEHLIFEWQFQQENN